MVWFTFATTDARDCRFFALVFRTRRSNRSEEEEKHMKKKKAKMIIYCTADCGALSNETAAMGNPLRGQGSR
jgi:hypothetical protein